MKAFSRSNKIILCLTVLTAVFLLAADSGALPIEFLRIWFVGAAIISFPWMMIKFWQWAYWTGREDELKDIRKPTLFFDRPGNPLPSRKRPKVRLPKLALLVIVVFTLAVSIIASYTYFSAKNTKSKLTPEQIDAIEVSDGFSDLGGVPVTTRYSPAGRRKAREELHQRYERIWESSRNDELLEQVRRANDIAERDLSQRQTDSSDADFNRRRAEQSAQDIETELRRMRINQETRPLLFLPLKNDEWILRYNAMDSHWQYAPPDARLKYNALESRWEFVP